ncbi:MAG: apolipoprotein N-acyltransferase, partial [Rickettsiales bacterium]|nr:apolipoprotein N-acyltransferase [Rickettsiales bacterium]
SGFPWNLPGYAFGFSLASLQLASVLGIYGLSFFAALLGVSPAFLTVHRGKLLCAGVWALFFMGILWGALRVPDAPQPSQPGVQLRLVQANIAQPEKWNPDHQRLGMEEHMRLTLSEGVENVTHIIWPETAVPYVLQADSPLARMLGETLPPGKMLLAGSLRSDSTDFASMQLWNSLSLLDNEGHIQGVYDKAHLVPFGEFQPLRPYVPKEWMTPVGEKDFSWGTASQVLNWPGLPPLLPLICYEAIFPELAQGEDERPAWLLNITNDAWFGTSTGPHQHFHMARMRAVEQGVPLVRVANTGISAIIDPYGRITAKLPLGTQGVIDGAIPQPTETKTFYSIFHLWVVPALLFLALLAGIFTRHRR